jgi:hypothetical protein
MENDQHFFSLSCLLDKKEIGLLIQSSVDIEHQIEMKRFYLIMGNADGVSLILQNILTRDEIISTVKREVFFNDYSSNIVSALDSMGDPLNFNPNDYEIDFFENVDKILSGGNLISFEGVKKKQSVNKNIPQGKKPIVLKKITNLK